MIPRAYKDCVCGYCGYRDLSVYQNHNDPICAECWKRQHGKTTSDNHHLYGRTRNDTVLIPANLHAYLTEAKKSWPKVLNNFPIDPLLQIAYSLRMIKDLVTWYLNHPEKFKTLLREQIDQIFLAVSINLENYSDWLIALQNHLVKVNGKDYYQNFGIAPLLIQSLKKDR
jgi:hypothetical protein